MNEKCEQTVKSFKMRPGYSYVPFQELGRLYTPEAALSNGTIFPELNLTMEEYERGLCR